MGHSPIPAQNAGTSGVRRMLNLGLTAVQDLPNTQLKQLMVEKDKLHLQSPELFMLSSFTKWNHHKAIYLDRTGSATHRHTFMSWDPLLYPELLLRIYIKYCLLKILSTISSKPQSAAFSIRILNTPYKNSVLAFKAPNTRLPMDEILCLLYLTMVSRPTQFPFVPWFPGSSRLNLVFNCSHSHTIQHIHISFCLQKRTFPVSCFTHLFSPQWSNSTRSLQNMWKVQKDLKQQEK